MDSEEIDTFFNALGVNSETDLVVFAVSMHMGAAQMGEYSFKEFEKACTELKCTNIADWTRTIG